MLVECRTCGAEIDAPINSDLGAAQCGVCRQDGADNMGAILTPEQMVDAHRIQAEMDRQDRLSTLAARVVEAAVRIAEDDRFFACATNGCSCSLDEADECAGNVLTFDAQWKALSAAVDALLAAKEGR